MKRNVMKTVLLALVMLLSPSQMVWGQVKLTKEEKRAQKMLDKGEKLANGMVCVKLQGGSFKLFDEDFKKWIKDQVSPLAQPLWWSATSSNVLLYCMPYDEVHRLFPMNVEHGNAPRQVGKAVLFNNGFFKENVNWFGEVHNGAINGKGYGCVGIDGKLCFFQGECHKGLPQGDLYCYTYSAEQIFKDTKAFKDRKAVPVVTIYPFHDGYARVVDHSWKYYINEDYQRCVIVNEAMMLSSILHNIDKNNFTFADFHDFKDKYAELEYNYKLKNKASGKMKFAFDRDLKFAGFSPESDKAITGLLDGIIAKQIAVLNGTNLDDPEKALEGMGVDTGDFIFCKDLREILTRGFQKDSFRDSFPHLWKRLEMINTLNELFYCISSQLQGYRGLIEDGALGRGVSSTGIDKDWMSKKLSRHMSSFKELAGDPIFPATSKKGLQNLEREINKLDKDFLIAYNDALKLEEEVRKQREAERKRQMKSYHGGGIYIPSSSENSEQSDVDIEEITMSDFSYTIDDNWYTTITDDVLDQKRKTVKFTDNDGNTYKGHIFTDDHGNLFLGHTTPVFYDSMTNVIIAAYCWEKYTKLRETGQK